MSKIYELLADLVKTGGDFEMDRHGILFIYLDKDRKGDFIVARDEAKAIAILSPYFVTERRAA